MRIEAETPVEKGTTAELKSQVETVLNKDEMIDVTSCTRGHGYKGCYPLKMHQVAEEDTSRTRVLEHGIQPAFSGNFPVQISQVSITDLFNMKYMEDMECPRVL